ncbi:MAG: TonB-dependent receptor [Bacteroidales bacterium]|nr:TonB-dependent receptor [Bacteroidales bacterium]
MNNYHSIFIISVFMLRFIVLFSQEDTTLQTLSELAVLGTGDLLPVKDTSETEIITASRTSKNLSDLPVTIHVITHGEILQNQYTSLTDILKVMPGIRVSQPGSGETGDYFEIRGLTGNFYSKILLNGIPVKPSVVKGMPVGAQIPVRQAERIEIIYGPAAAIYGADAAAGVINIITKEADQGTFARADISLGQNDYNYFNFTIGGKAGKNNNILKYTFYGSKTEFNDMNIKYDVEKFYNPLNYFQDSIMIGGTLYSPAEINESTPGIYDFMNETYGRYYEGKLKEPLMEELPAMSHMVGVNLNFRGVRITFDNMYRRSHSSVGHNTYRYKYNNPQNYWGDLIRLYSISYHKDWKRFSTFTQVSGLSYRMDNNSSIGLTFLENTDKVYRYAASSDILFEQLITLLPIDNLEVVTGLSFQESGYLPLTSYLAAPFKPGDYTFYSNKVLYVDTVFGNPGFYPGRFTNLSGFIQGFLKKNRFRIMGGLRVDHNTRYGTKLSPRLGLLYKHSRLTALRLSAGSAFKSPPASLEYETIAYPVSQNRDSLHYDVIRTAALEPEKFISVELGMNTRIFWQIHMNLSLFYNEIYNQFFPLKTSTEGLISNAVNDSVLTKKNENTFSRVYGIQANFRKNNIIPSVKMNAEVNLMFAKTSQKLPDVESFLENFKLMPRHFGQLKLSFCPAKNLYLHFENTWESKWLRNLIFLEKIYNDLFKKVDGYFTLDALISYNFSHSLCGFIKITNMFNEKYSGLNVTGRTEDKLYNPQLGRNIRIGLSYALN